MAGEAKAVDLPFNEAVAFFRQKTNMKSSHWTEVMDEAHARGFAVAGATKDALIEDFRQAIDKAISEHSGFREFRGTFDEIVKKHGWQHTGRPGWRAKVIYETNMRTAFAAGRYAQMTDPAVLAAFPYWMYQHVSCAHPRLQHVAWSGMVLRADDPFWASCYPPNGWGCHCIVIALNDRMMGRLGKSAPDPSPKLQWREYINRTTGRVTKYPLGVDPGFVGNPGKAWKEGAASLKTPDVTLVPAEKPVSVPPVQRFKTPEAADEVLAKAMAPWAEKLTPDENDALASYKGLNGRDINAAVRAGDNKDRDLALTGRILEAALDRAKMPITVRSWRAIGPAEAAIYAALRPGQSVVAEAFVSASVVEEVAQKLSKSESRIVIEIIVPAGTRGAAYVHPFPDYRFRQYEVLLNVGIKLRMVRNDGSRAVLIAGDEDK